jgi:hypothetical protein
MSAKRKPRRSVTSKVNHRLPAKKKKPWVKSIDTSLELCLFAGHLVAVVTLVLEQSVFGLTTIDDVKRRVGSFLNAGSVVIP